MKQRHGLLVVLALLLVAAAASASAPAAAQEHGHRHGPEQRGSSGWPYQGDPGVRRGLLLAAAQATGQQPRQVLEQLRAGRSIAAIAEAGGKSAADVLALYDQAVERRVDEAVESGRLPASLAQGRKSWFKSAGRQMVDQPGLRPAYPGLHELHSTIIGAAAQVSGVPRREIREQLLQCRTLEEILAQHGQSGQAALDLALGRLAGLLDALVQQGQLSQQRRDSWQAGIAAALEQMLATPGLHVAGKQCAE